MPELPEVENVRRGLAAALNDQPKLVNFKASALALRVPVPKAQLKKLLGKPVREITRWGKYLFFQIEDGRLLNHLGMTGKWKIISDASLEGLKLEKHDHLALELSNRKILVYHDPRRFGWVEWIAGAGVGPVDATAKDPTLEKIDAAWLRARFRGRKTPIKSALLNQDILAGLGNIYVSEVLFRARIKPTRRTDRLTLVECALVLTHVNDVLNEAIAAGGSTIRDYANANGESGGFQDRHQVYDRARLPCVVCATPIKAGVIAGRSTYWCIRCQK